MDSGHALISGGSSGIGLALARRLAGAGWNVSIVARDATRLEAARRDIEAARRNPDQRVLALSADVADSAATAAAVRDAIAALGAPDLLVTSAGIVVPHLFVDTPLDAFKRTMDVNYLGTVNMVHAALPAMRAKRGGRIVFISSGAAFIGIYGYSSYAPSKFAVRGLGEVLRAELVPEGVGVSVVYPPDTDTPQLKEELPQRPAALAKIAGGSAVLSADAVADAILKGIAKKRFLIAPGLEMAALARLHSLIGPALNRFWFDRVVARWHDSGQAKRP